MKFVFNNIDKEYVKNRHERMGDIQPKYWFSNAEHSMVVKRQFSQKVTGQQQKSKMFNHFGEYFGYLLAKKAGIKACPVKLITVHDNKNKYSPSVKLYTACGSIKVLKPHQDMVLGEMAVLSFEHQFPEQYKAILKEILCETEPLGRKISILDPSDNIDVIVQAVAAQTIHYEKQFGKRSTDEIREDVHENLSDLFNMVVYDCMFGNNDRHSQNWATYSDPEDGRLRMYPLYDNERVLGLSRTEVEMKRTVNCGNLDVATEEECFSRMGISPMHSGVSYKKMLKHIVKKYPEYAIPAIKNITDRVSVQDIEELFDAAEGITLRSEFSEELTEADELPQEYRIYARNLYSSRRAFARNLLEKNKNVKPKKRNLEEESMVI